VKTQILINDYTEIGNKEWTGDYCNGEVITEGRVGFAKMNNLTFRSIYYELPKFTPGKYAIDNNLNGDCFMK